VHSVPPGLRERCASARWLFAVLVAVNLGFDSVWHSRVDFADAFKRFPDTLVESSVQEGLPRPKYL